MRGVGRRGERVGGALSPRCIGQWWAASNMWLARWISRVGCQFCLRVNSVKRSSGAAASGCQEKRLLPKTGEQQQPDARLAWLLRCSPSWLHCLGVHAAACCILRAAWMQQGVAAAAAAVVVLPSEEDAAEFAVAHALRLHALARLLKTARRRGNGRRAGFACKLVYHRHRAPHALSHSSATAQSNTTSQQHHMPSAAACQAAHLRQ